MLAAYGMNRGDGRRLHWVCSACGRRYRVDAPAYACGCATAGWLELRPRARLVRRPYRPEVTDSDRTLWRYAALAPLDPARSAAGLVRTRFPAGGTPLTRIDRLAAQAGLDELWAKDESANPTGALADRATSLVVAGALHLGRGVVATGPSVRTAVSTAAGAQAVGLRCVVFASASIGPDMRERLTGLGADVLTVDGSSQDAVELSLRACDRFGWVPRANGLNPFTTQGVKTVALEIAEQLGWQAPDVLLAPFGDGNVLVGMFHAFRDARRLGWVRRTPRLVGVRSTTGPPRVDRAGPAGGEQRWSAFVAADRAAGTVDGHRAVSALVASDGAVVAVTKGQILEAVVAMADREGIVADPAAAVAFAALPTLSAAGLVSSAERIVVVSAGHQPTGPPGPGGPPRPAPGVAPDDLDGVRAALLDRGDVFGT